MPSRLTALSPTHRPAANAIHIGLTRRKLRVRYLLLVLVLGFAAYHYWFVQRVQYNQLQRKELGLQKELSAMELKRGELSRSIQELQSNGFIAQYASQHFGLVLPGQVSFVVRH